MMQNVKSEALAQLQGMPDNITWDQIAYRFYLRASIERSMAEIDAGKGIPHEQVMKEINEWLASSGANRPAVMSGTI
jgi:predicted transcriptional regulator